MDNKNQISLRFRLQEDIITVEKVNINQPLSVSLKKALEGTSKEPKDYNVEFNKQQVDTSSKVKDLGLVDNDLLKLILKDGGGGTL